MSITDHDHRTIRCPRLGGEATVEYCRKAGQPFCPTLVVCWAVRLDIGGFLAGHYSPAEIQSGLQPPGQSKVQRIVDLAAKAREES